MEIYTNQDWDTETNQWVNQYRYFETTTVSGNNTTVTYTDQEWTGFWLNRWRLSDTQDNNGNWLGMMDEEWNTETNQWEIMWGYRIIPVYDNNGNLIQETVQLYEQWEDSTWVNYWNSLYTYDDNENRIQETHQDWNSETETWVNSDNYLCAYDDNGNRTQETYQNWNSETETWVNYRNYLYTYDDNGNRTQRIYQNWVGDSIWVNSSNYLCAYDDNGNRIQETYQNWNSETETWVNYRNYLYAYDDNGNITQRIYQNWNSETETWVTNSSYSYFHIYDYDGNENLVQKIRQNWNSETDDWINDYKYDYFWSDLLFVDLTFEDTEAAPGDINVSVPVLLDNETDLTTAVAGLQFNINYDATKGIHANGNSNLTNRTTDFTSNVIVHENGANSYVQVLLFDVSGNAVINSGTGAVVDILFDVNDTASVGNFSDLIFSDVILSNSLAQPVPVIFSENGTFTIISPFALGDINGDGNVSIFDIVLIAIIIGENTYVANADLNNDGNVNIFDLMLLVNIINGNGKGEVYDIKGGNIITLPELSLNSGASGSFNIQTNNPDIISATEFSFGYNSLIGFDITSLELPENMNNDFELSYIINSEDPANVNVKVIVYSLTNKEIAVGVSDIVKVNYTTSETANGFSDLSFTSAILCNSNATALETETVSGMLTIGNANSVKELQIHNFNVYPNPFSETAKIEIILKRASNVSFTVYNLMGELVYESSETAFEKGKNNYEINLNGQPSGTYFISINIDNKRYYHKLIKQ